MPPQKEVLHTMEFKEPLLVCRVRTKKQKSRDKCKYRYFEMKRKLGSCICILRVLRIELQDLWLCSL